jgi:prophage antirepressor-like protein
MKLSILYYYGGFLMENGILNIHGVDCYEKDGIVYLRLETVARGLGFTRIAASGNEVVRWETVRKYLNELGVPTSWHDDSQLVGKDGLPEFIPENIFYRLAMKAKNETAERFQAKIADEVIPTIRRTGSYSAKPMTLAEQALAQAQILVDHEKQLAELSESVDKLERFNDGIVAVLAPTAVSDGWQEQMNRKVRQYCLDYDLDYRVAFNQLYMTVESSTRSDLTRRVENRRKRILQNGGTRAEADKVTKLSVIANDAALRNAFDLALKNMCVASYARHGDEVGV